MLVLVFTVKEKKATQAKLKRSLIDALPRRERRTISYRGGGGSVTVHWVDDGQLWAVFGSPSGIMRRYFNAFGIYRPKPARLTETVDMNIPVDRNTAQVARFFAEDTETGDVFLMHSGKVGGGRGGIGKSAFLTWSKAKLIEVAKENGSIRSGIAVGKLGEHDLAERIWTFVTSVQRFKEAVAAGELGTPEFMRRVEQFDKYSREFSGKKRGVRGGAFQYITYHGDIVHRLYEDRTSRLAPDENVFSSHLIDLFVKKDGALSEVYEVKTGVGRQILYTAIGQIMTHGAYQNGQASRFLVIPAKEDIPQDLKRAISLFNVRV